MSELFQIISLSGLVGTIFVLAQIIITKEKKIYLLESDKNELCKVITRYVIENYEIKTELETLKQRSNKCQK